MRVAGDSRVVSIPPIKPTLERAREELAAWRNRITQKLRHGEQTGAPLEFFERGEAALAEVDATTPEQMLERLMEDYRPMLAEFRERIWTSFVSIRGRRYENCSFENYDVVHDKQRIVVETLRGYASDMAANVASGVNVVLHGTCGTGKDHLLVAMARIAIVDHGFTLGWTSGVDMSANAKTDLEHERNRSAMSKLYGAPTGEPTIITYISDPAPPGGPAAFYGANRLYQVVDDAYNERRPIWVSINATNRQHASELVGEQVIDRLTDGAVVCNCSWPSHRKPG